MELLPCLPTERGIVRFWQSAPIQRCRRLFISLAKDTWNASVTISFRDYTFQTSVGRLSLGALLSLCLHFVFGHIHFS